MKYMLLLWGDTSTEYASDADYQEDMAKHMAFSEVLAARNANRGGEALLDPPSARTLRKEGDEVVVTDGPFVDLKEFIGGYYIIEAADMDEAVELARHCPNYAGIEIRPIWELPESIEEEA